MPSRSMQSLDMRKVLRRTLVFGAAVVAVLTPLVSETFQIDDVAGLGAVVAFAIVIAIFSLLAAAGGAIGFMTLGDTNVSAFATLILGVAAGSATYALWFASSHTNWGFVPTIISMLALAALIVSLGARVGSHV